MKTLLEEALSRESKPVSTAPAVIEDMRADSELESILAQMKTKVRIFGCGGSGCNTIARITEEGIAGAELFAANTDAQHLLSIRAPKKILLGRRTTRGLGAGSIPQLGEEAARENEDEIKKYLTGSDMVFVTCGLGGGTGTGGSFVISKLAKDTGALTVAFVTLPFKGEGMQRMENAEWGLEKLRQNADTVIAIPNDRLLDLVPRLSLNAAFRFADEVLMRAIKGLAEVITKPGLVNLDFNDIKTIMQGGGVAMIGLGESDAVGDNRAIEALNEAVESPLLDVDISSASGVLVNVTGGNDMTVSEAEKAVEEIQGRVSPNARIIWGASVDPTLEHTLKVMLIVTGVKSKQILGRSTTPAAREKMGVDVIS
ncbi:MAG: cell division protein FtsZ [Thermoplasmata archaeon]